LIYYWVKPSQSGQDEIIIDDEMVARSISLFKNDWGRPPSGEELEGLIERQIRLEVLYRQALKLNLDHNDELIKRRMEQKVNFITNDLATIKEPSEDTLKAFKLRHGDKYKIPETVSFVHIYINPEKRTEARRDALAILATLPKQDKVPKEKTILGDTFPLLQVVDDMARKEIASQMGDDFADSLLKTPVGIWHGPVLSGFGLHLVYVKNHTPAKEPEWATVRADVKRDYEYEYAEMINEKMYQDFRKQFKVSFILKDSTLLKTGIDKKLGN
jgi:parvulin-like peptidyl-prolyl isomerase